MRSILTYQYDLVKSSREVVFQFCEKFDPIHYTRAMERFGRGSICNTQIHIANTYTFWVANSIMEKSISYLEYKQRDLITVRKAFNNVNFFMEEFIKQYSEKIYEPRIIKIKDDSEEISATLLQVFTHVITHEFHHKGQIMSMGRQLGYVPPDADIIRFS